MASGSPGGSAGPLHQTPHPDALASPGAGVGLESGGRSLESNHGPLMLPAPSHPCVEHDLRQGPGMPGGLQSSSGLGRSWGSGSGGGEQPRCSPRPSELRFQRPLGGPPRDPLQCGRTAPDTGLLLSHPGCCELRGQVGAPAGSHQVPAVPNDPTQPVTQQPKAGCPAFLTGEALGPSGEQCR